jgi:sigma-54 interacting transcriptional regulator
MLDPARRRRADSEVWRPAGSAAVFRGKRRGELDLCSQSKKLLPRLGWPVLSNLRWQGTLFLDEVGDIPLEMQSKLLRVLQEQEFKRLGSTRTLRVNVRLVLERGLPMKEA